MTKAEEKSLLKAPEKIVMEKGRLESQRKKNLVKYLTEDLQVATSEFKRKISALTERKTVY